MNQPLGRLTALQYRRASFYTDDGREGQVDVLRVHLRVPDGSEHYQDLPNGEWSLDNTALGFLALWGYRPSDIGGHDEAMRDAEPDLTCVPVAPTPDGWGLAQTALEGARDALESAEWFDPDTSPSDGNKRAHAPPGGAEPDPGTGNKAGVEIEKADEDSDAGMVVSVQ